MKNSVAQAMILAAGEGTRLRPLTLATPKVLILVGGAPLITHIIAWLKYYGIKEIVLNLCYLGEKIKAFLGDGSRFGIKIRYSDEEELLGTAGGVKKVEQFFDGTFAVVYGDNLTDFDLSEMVRFHREKKALITLALFYATNTSEVGIVEQDEQGRILGFVEKPQPGSTSGNLANGGVYVIEKEALNSVPDHGFADFARDIFPKMIKLGLPVYGYVLGKDDYFIDIGTPKNYARANEDMKAGKVKTRAL